MKARLAPGFFIMVFASYSILIGMKSSGAEELPNFPVCNIADSAGAEAAAVDSILHMFGQDTTQYPHEFDLPSNHPAFS